MRVPILERRVRQAKAASVLSRRLGIAVVLLVAAARLPGATVLPGSFAELTGGGGHYELALDDGSHVSVSADGSSLPFFPGIWNEDFIDPYYDDGGSDVSIAVNSDSIPNGLVGSYFFFTGPPVSTGGDMGVGPFSFYGIVVEQYDGGRTLEFTGKGTVYFNFNYFEDHTGSWREIERVRYEFEAIDIVPEGSTWVLFLLGLGAAYLASKK